MPTGITAMLPVVHHPTDQILQHIDESAASSNMAAPASSFAKAHDGHNDFNPYLGGNHYVQPSAFSGGTDTNKYLIEKEGPGFRAVLKNEVAENVKQIFSMSIICKIILYIDDCAVKNCSD